MTELLDSTSVLMGIMMVKGKNRKKDIDKVWVKTQTFIYYEKHNIICKTEGVDKYVKVYRKNS